MSLRSTVRLVCLVLVAVAGAWGADAPSPQPDALGNSYAAMYNLDFPQAQTSVQEFERGRPDDPRGPISEAAAILFQELDRLGILESQYFTDDHSFRSLRKRADPALRARFDKAVERGEKMANAQLTSQPSNCDALHALTFANGLRADYTALVEDRGVAALRYTKSATATARRLLAECKDYDAYVATGISQYLIGTLSAPLRWMLRLGGYSGDKKQGIAELQLASQRGRYLAPFARILLSIACIRDKDYPGAKNLLASLGKDYPRNPLFARELARLNAQAD